MTKEFKLGTVLGVNAEGRDEMVAYSTGIKISVVKAERTAAEKAARRAKWEAELVSRLPELIAWCRKDAEPCELCLKTRAALAAVWGPESPAEAPEGSVVFSIDLPEGRGSMGVERHDRYHVEKALRAIRTQEFKDREAKRARKSK
jgi:hypothetical protein